MRQFQRGQQILGYGRRTSAVISPCPAPIGLGRFDLGVARRLHAARHYECLDLVDVDFRPDAARAPRRETLEVVLIVESFFLTVDPAPTECDFHRLGVGNAGFLSALSLSHADRYRRRR